MNDDYSELVISQSLLDDIFVVRYLQALSKEAIVVYLWLNMTAGKNEFDEKSVKTYRVIPEAKVKEALTELLGAKLIRASKDKFVLEDLKHREVEEYVKICKARGEAGDIPGMSNSDEHKMLSASISKTFFCGVMDYNYYRLIRWPASLLTGMRRDTQRPKNSRSILRRTLSKSAWSNSAARQCASILPSSTSSGSTAGSII